MKKNDYFCLSKFLQNQIEYVKPCRNSANDYFHINKKLLLHLLPSETVYTLLAWSADMGNIYQENWALWARHFNRLYFWRCSHRRSRVPSHAPWISAAHKKREREGQREYAVNSSTTSYILYIVSIWLGWTEINFWSKSHIQNGHAPGVSRDYSTSFGILPRMRRSSEHAQCDAKSCLGEALARCILKLSIQIYEKKKRKESPGAAIWEAHTLDCESLVYIFPACYV